MPRRELLTITQRAELTAFPTLEERTLVQHYTLTREDLNLIKPKRRPENRLGFALELLTLRHLCWSKDVELELPANVIAFVAEQLELPAKSFTQYGARAATRSQHFGEVRQVLGLQGLTRSVIRELVAWLMPQAFATHRGLPLVIATMDELRRRRVLVPPVPSLERIVAGVLTRAARETFDALTNQLKIATLERLDALLERRDGDRISTLAWLRKPAPATSAKSFAGLIERLEEIRAFGLDPSLARSVHQNRLRVMAREGRQFAAHHLRDLEPLRRRATLVATLLDRSETLTDELLDMLERLLGRAFQHAQLRQDEQLRQHGKSINEKVILFDTVGQAIITARSEKRDVFAAIEAVVPWDRFVASVGEARTLAQPERFDAMHLLKDQALKVRKIIPPLFAAFSFSAAPVAEEVVRAVNILRDLQTRGKRTLPKDVPLGMVRAKWLPFVLPDGVGGKVDRAYYELCVTNELSDRLRSGDVWVAGSRKYRNFEAYLLPSQTWTQMLEADQQNQTALPLALPSRFESFWDERRSSLKSELDKVHAGLLKGGLSGARLEDGELVVTQLAKAVPEEAKVLTGRLYAVMPRIKITDLLLEVDSWTDFTMAFTHLHSGRSCEDLNGLLTAILADGINLGLTKMADASPGLTARRLGWLHDWHVRDDTYSGALAELTNFQSRQPFAALWGDGTTASSDGQQYKTGAHGNRHGRVNKRYGHAPGVTFYTHVSDQYAPFHTKVISANKRDATYVLDGLLYHESDLNIEEHYTDTHGYTEHVFALCALLGFKFAPRIRGITDSRLFLPDGFSGYSTLESMIGGTINRKHLEAHWNEILWLASSIKLGTVTASLILGKLGAYPRQNGLAVALRELGRLERTLFTLEWLQSPELRRRVLKGLNKGEARNSLADAVFFNQRGELRDRSLEAQSHRASGLNLVIAAISTWNTVYLERAVATLRARGEEVNDAMLEHVSPLGWEHINLTGDYVWRSDAIPRAGEFRVLNAVDRLE
jgi:TnpA family transposase